MSILRIERCGQPRQWMPATGPLDEECQAGPLSSLLQFAASVGAVASPWCRARDYIAGVSTGFMVKVPLPVQFSVDPVTDQVPLICPPLTVPFRVSVFDSAPVDMMMY